MDCEHLEGLAREATPGPWFHRQPGGNGAGLDWIGDHPDHGRHKKIVVARHALYGGSDDYAFIAAANPQAILALIAENRAYREALVSLQVQASNAAYNLNQVGITLDTADAARAFDNIALSARAALHPVQQGGQSHG